MWTQLLDFPGTYQEMSATCMIGYSMARGLRKGWLDQRFVSVLEKAWEGVNRRISNQGDLVDVCTGTGFQESREDYIYRAAEYGYDDRGGSMAIWFATEMERLQRSISNR
jgi:rhamnogalacturonyl hydrolase YesR